MSNWFGNLFKDGFIGKLFNVTVVPDSYPDTISPVVLVDGVDVTALIDPDTLKIENVLTKRVDSASFTLIDSASASLIDWDEVVITNGSGGPRLFGGYLQTSRDENTTGGLELDTEIKAADYSAILDRVLVRRQFTTPTTDKAMIQALFTEYLPEISTADYISEIKTYPRARFNRASLRECLDTIASSSSADWYVDADKKLHFFVSETEGESADFFLSDAPDEVTSFPYNDLKRHLDGTGVINRVEIVGGTYLSEDVTFFFPGTGQDARIIMPFKMTAPVGQSAIQVWRNDGTSGSPVWTPMTVKVGYIEALAGATDVLHYYQERVLEQSSAWPNLPNAVKVTARYDVPLRTRVSDPTSYDFYGRWLDAVYADPNIIDKNTSTLVGQGIIAQAALGKVNISLDCYKSGLRSGMRVRLVSASMGIDSTFLIQRVTTKLVSPLGYAVYSVDMGAYSNDLIDLIIKIARATQVRPIWRDDEVLDEIVTYDADSLPLTEGTPAVTATTAPYVYDSFRYDFWKYG